MLYHYCRSARHALDYAQRHGISPDSPRLRWARFVHTHVYATTWLQVIIRLLVVLPVTAGVMLVLTDILSADAISVLPSSCLSASD